MHFGRLKAPSILLLKPKSGLESDNVNNGNQRMTEQGVRVYRPTRTSSEELRGHAKQAGWTSASAAASPLALHEHLQGHLACFCDCVLFASTGALVGRNGQLAAVKELQSQKWTEDMSAERKRLTTLP